MQKFKQYLISISVLQRKEIMLNALSFTLCLLIILLVRFGLLSDHLLGNSYPLGWSFVFVVSCLFVILVISHFDFEGGICLMIALVPVH